MASVVINQCHFDVPEGTGTPIKASCLIHGPFTAWIPFDLDGHDGYLNSNTVPCPTCNAPSMLSEGAFDFTQGVVRELYGLSLSRQVRRRFEREVQTAASKEQAVFKAEQIHPKLGESVRRATEKSSWKERLILLATIITILAEAPDAIDNADAAAVWVWEQVKSKTENSEMRDEPSNQDKNENTNTGDETLKKRDGDQNMDWNDTTEI